MSAAAFDSDHPVPATIGLADVEIGVVVRPHGVRGEIRVRLHNPASEAIQRSERLTLDLASWGRRDAVFRVTGVVRDGLVLSVEGIRDREAAEALRGARVLVPREAVVLEEGEYLYGDLLGCRVLDERGRALGVIVEVFTAGASDVIVVRDGPFERLIPWVDQWIREVSLEERTVHVEGGDQWEPQPA